ncbi:MAG: NAD(+) diphosphatase [Homoserinimonas sp.]
MEDRFPPRLTALATTQLPLSRNELDRDYLARGRDDLFEVLMAQSETRVLTLWKRTALMAGDSLALLSVRDLPAAATSSAEVLVYLGRTITDSDDVPGGTPIVAAVVSDAVADLLDDGPESWGDLRRIAGRLSDRDAGLLTQAVAMANWHDSHRFSPQTGEPLVVTQGGWTRVDSRGEVFPRTDPAVIVAVIDDDDRILLGTNSQWEANRYSLLAGFVEAGESLEAAVAREVFEESGVRVVDPVYLGSQPWPFPASLMLGFTARVDPGRESTLAPDGDEILALRWFSRDELRAALGEITLPGHSSIARAILEQWYGGPIEPGGDAA